MSSISTTDTQTVMITVTEMPCEFTTCPEGEIQDLFSCSCVAMYPVFGDLLDVFADDFNGYYRIDNG